MRSHARDRSAHGPRAGRAVAPGHRQLHAPCAGRQASLIDLTVVGTVAHWSSAGADCCPAGGVTKVAEPMGVIAGGPGHSLHGLALRDGPVAWTASLDTLRLVLGASNDVKLY